MRGALKILLLLAILLVVAGATLPWWLGAALAPLARARGVTFTRYERVGYTRFQLADVAFTRPSLRFSAQQVTLDTPLAWLLESSRARAEISGWQLRLDPAPPTRAAQPAASSPTQVHADLQKVTTALRRWLPQATAENGTISRGGQMWQVERASWHDGTLEAHASAPQIPALHLVLSERDGAFVATAESPALDARAEVQWTPDALRGTARWHGQPATLDARFEGNTWRLRHAELRAENWDLPAAEAKLAPAFDRVRGHLRAAWSGDRFTVDLQATGIPATGQKAPPLELAAAATGDRSQIVVQALQLRAPFGQASLSAPLAFSFADGAVAAPAVLAIDADLARQTWFAATGIVRGEIRATPGRTDSQGEFRGTIDGLQWGKLVAQSVRLRGSWRGTRAQFDEVSATLDAASHIAANGSLDWKRRELGPSRLDATLAETWLKPLLPPDVACDRVVAAAELEGPLAAPRHRGELEISQLHTARLQPTALRATWTGEALALSNVTAIARAGSASLHIAGSAIDQRATVRELRLQREGHELLRNVAPATIEWIPHLKIAGLRLESADRALACDFDGSDAPRIFVSAQNLSSAWLSDWWQNEVPATRLNSLSLHGQVRDGVLAGDLALQASTDYEGASWTARVAASAQPDGVRISQLEISSARGTAAAATGRIPLRTQWARVPRVEFDSRAPLELQASISSASPLWELVRRLTPFAIEGGALEAQLAGSLAAPRGLLRVEAARIARVAPGAENSVPEITALSATIRGARDGLRLDPLTAQVAGYPVRATGQLPLDEATWSTLLHTPRAFDWRRIELQISAPQIDLATLARAFPTLPFSEGKLAAEVSFARGEFTGRAELHGGATHPLPGLGRLLAIETELALKGRTIEVQKFAARLGGEPVELTGTAALDDRNQPDVDLRLRAKNVPLVRRPGLLVRTDLDLQAKTPARGPTRITGRVDLRDALVLADLAAILPGGPRGVSRPPPYFSVATEPFSRWGLDVHLTGARAVRVRTAVFNGLATPQFQLTGTLGDPRAIGQLSVDEGQVLFPFARFEVQQGAVRLTAADPTHPQLAVNAAAKRLGYELRLEAGGTVAAPTLAFSSNPPLESADILLLVTTGQPPKEEIAGPSNQQRLTRLGTFLGTGIFQNFGSTEDRLEITSGEQISEAGRETYRAEYKVTDKLSLTGEYDQYDDYNAGISYRIYTKEGAKREERKK